MKIPNDLKVGDRIIIGGKVIDSKGVTRYAEDLTITKIRHFPKSTKVRYLASGFEEIYQTPHRQIKGSRELYETPLRADETEYESVRIIRREKARAEREGET